MAAWKTLRVCASPQREAKGVCVSETNVAGMSAEQRVLQSSRRHITGTQM